MAYTKINWENAPSKKTPINDTNLNHMDDGIAANDAAITDLKTRVTQLETSSGTASTDITQLKSKVDTLENKVSTIEATIADVPHWETVS